MSRAVAWKDFYYFFEKSTSSFFEYLVVSLETYNKAVGIKIRKVFVPREIAIIVSPLYFSHFSRGQQKK